MKKVMISALVALVMLSAFVSSPGKSKTLTFEQAATQGWNAFVAFAAVDTSNAAALSAAYALAVEKMLYIDNNFDIAAELDARRPGGSVICSVLGYFDWLECTKSSANWQAQRFCQRWAAQVVRDCNRMWPWLPKP